MRWFPGYGERENSAFMPMALCVFGAFVDLHFAMPLV